MEIIFRNQISLHPLFRNTKPFYGKCFSDRFCHTPNPILEFDFWNSISAETLTHPYVMKKQLPLTFPTERDVTKKGFKAASTTALAAKRTPHSPPTYCTTHPFNILLRMFQVL